tara:strand:+ start:4966 stop:6105 length:1140 start_codon:yes stop_codon:yes gene_type:complete
MHGQRKKVALIVETSLGSGREILRGIASFAHQTENWEVFHAVRSLEEAVPDWLDDWDGDGVIARVQNAEIAHNLNRLKIPVIDVLGVYETNFPLVHVDDHQISALIADHFLQRDFQHFAFYGIEGENWSERRRDAFRQSCKDAKSFHVLETGRHPDDRRLRAWLRGLPKPVAIMVCSDQGGLILLEACRIEGISVPEQAAVAGVDNDLALCEISAPPLTSVRGGHFRVGFEAAKWMDRLLDGEAPPASTVLVPPTGIVDRESTDSRGISDPVVRKAMQFIRENLASPIDNEAIGRAAGVSRSRIQQRFRLATGRSIREFLVDHRLKRAVDLIRRSDLPFAEIASRTGFRHQEYLGYVLKQRLDKTPGQIRAGAQVLRPR